MSLIDEYTNLLIKIITKTKIDTKEEYKNIKKCVAFYECFLDIGKIDYNSTKLFGILSQLKTLLQHEKNDQKGITFIWLQDCICFSREIQEGFYEFLSGENIFKYPVIISKAKRFCKDYEVLYAEWGEEIRKYENGVKRIIIYGLTVLAFGLSTLISSCSTIFENTAASTVDEKEFFIENDLQESSLEEEIAFVLERIKK